MEVTSDGKTLYVAALGTSEIGIYDTAELEADTSVPITARQIPVSGGGPTGLALDETNGKLYALTRFDNSISIIDTTTNSLQGPMVTQSLRGMANHGPMHWRGDKTAPSTRPRRSPIKAPSTRTRRSWPFRYLPNRSSGASLSDAELRAQYASTGLTYTCAPPGNGTRLALDRNLDGALDGDELDVETDPADPDSN